MGDRAQEEEAVQVVSTDGGGIAAPQQGSGKAPKAAGTGSEENVLLRIEFISKSQGNILQWVVAALTLVLVGITLAVFIRKLTNEGSDGVLFDDGKIWCDGAVGGAARQGPKRAACAEVLCL